MHVRMDACTVQSVKLNCYGYQDVIIITAIFTAVIKVIIRVIFHMPTLGLVHRYSNLRNCSLEHESMVRVSMVCEGLDIFCLVS